MKSDQNIVVKHLSSFSGGCWKDILEPWNDLDGYSEWEDSHYIPNDSKKMLGC